MKILSLQAENVKRIEVLEMKPRGKGLVIVAGNNGAGKSTVLDCIMIGLSGTDSMPSKPVRRGEDKARIEIDLGDLVVTRTITATGGGSLVVRNKDGEKQSTPQAILDKLFNDLSFDPMEFRAQKSEQRSETLRALVGLNFDQLEADIKRIYDERTAVNREVKTYEAQLKACPEHEGAGSEEVDPAELNAKLESAFKIGEAKLTAARRHNEANAKVKAKWQEASSGINSVDLAIDNYKADIADLQRQLSKHEADLAEALNARAQGLAVLAEREKEVAALKYEDEDVIMEENRKAREPIQKSILDVDASNRKARDNQKKAELRTIFKTKTRESDSLTDKIEKLEKSKRDAIQSAKFPIPGLSLSDTREVLFNGIPFDQCSTAEQLRVSVAMGLAMNPKLRILLIKQGNDLDDDNLRLMGEMAETADAQLWIERVSTAGDVSVIIEDGHVKIVDAKPEQETLAV